MLLSFNLENIKYLKMEYTGSEYKHVFQLALKEKLENYFIAVASADFSDYIETPQIITLDFITNDGLYRTNTVLRNVRKDAEYTYFEIENPASLDYQQNREHYRIITKYDCIFSVETENGTESYNSVTYDISTGGVSIITDNIRISQEEMSIIIFMPDREIKSHLRFIRCERFEDNMYKMSFEFTDLADNDYVRLSRLCLKTELPR